MGQYYKIFVLNGNETHVFAPSSSKLMEHAFLNDDSVNAVIDLIFNSGPCRVAWVGDYYENRNIPNTPFTGDDIWDREAESIKRSEPPTVLWGKSLANIEKKLYVDFSDYHNNPAWKYEDDTTHPLPLLTACGNGAGGGDYYGSEEPSVGSWAGDLLMVVDGTPDGFEKLDIVFREGAYN